VTDRSAAGHSGLSWTARLFFGGLAIASAGLGFAGLGELLPPAPEQDFWNRVYFTLQLFVLDSSPLQTATDLPWELQVARFSAPVVTAYLLFLAVESLVSEWFGRLRARLARGHSILCGPPEITAELADQIRRERGHPMVVGLGVRPGRLRGPLAVAGDPRRPETLQRAGVDRAKEVLVVGGDSALNAEIAVAVQGGGRRIACLVEAGNHELFRAIVRQGADGGGLRPDTFHRDVQAARAVVDRSPPLRDPDTPARVLIVGYEGLGEAVLRRLVASWARDHGGAIEAHVTVLDPAVPPRIVRNRHPEAEKVARIDAHRVDPRWFSSLADLHLPPGASGKIQVYVCLASDGDALRCGDIVLQLLRTEPRLTARVAVAVSSSPLIGRREDPSRGRDPDGLVLINVLQEVYAVASLRIGPSEQLARAIHGYYLRAGAARGESAGTNPSMLPWEDLPEYLRQSNREQAWAIGDRLVAIGRSAVSVAVGVEVHNPPLADAVVERLARTEHVRWVEERIEAGWQRGEFRDAGRLLHPDLVPWPELPAEAREKDRDAIRAIPDLLAGVGLQIITTRP
jgi:voltage-gated potassium channel Kch